MASRYDVLLDLLRARRSAYAFADRPVSDADLRALLEAARLAPSSYNEQPWRLVLARPGDKAYDALLAALTGHNATWAATAPALGLTVVSPTLACSDAPNRWAWHDAGLAMMALALAAEARGLSVHQIAGLDATAAATAMRVPEAVEVMAAFALGHPADTPGAGLPPDLAARDGVRKGRRAVDDVAFGPTWGIPLERLPVES